VICRKGLTLIELLVALTITGLMMGSGYGALSVMVDHRARVMAATDAVASAAAKRRMLKGWLRGARLNIYGDATFEGLHGVDEDRPDDAVTFLTNAPTPLGTNETVVRIYIDRDDQTPERGVTVALTDRKGGATRRIEVDPRATGLDIRYLSGVFGKRAWLESWVSTTVLPSAVRLTVSSEQPDSLPSLLRPPIVVPLGSVQ
jgi:prepilin-type N-terminal cleavage/methylation domain-containing protein